MNEVNMVDIAILVFILVLLGLGMWLWGMVMGRAEERAKIRHSHQRNYNVWLHQEDMDYRDQNGVNHEHYMCPRCGFTHDFLDGHTSQYQYCPQCGLFLG